MRSTFVLALALALAGSAFAANKPPKRRHINIPGRPVNAPFSDAVLVGDTLYIAGRIGFDPKSGKLPDNVDQEARNLLDGFKAVLAQADMTMDDLVNVQVFCPDVSLFDRWNAVYRTYFKKDFPSRAFIGSGPLLFHAHFEMQGTAVRGGAEAAKKKQMKADPEPSGN